MQRIFVLLTVFATPAFAASGPFFSLGNTDFVVLLGFIAFVSLLIYLKVPAKLTGLLDARAVQIKAELDEARALRDEAKSILATYERRQKEVKEQADRIVRAAREEAMAAAEQAKADLKAAITRRLAAATDQIASAEAAAIRQVRQEAISVAVAAAGDVLASQMTTTVVTKSIDTAIDQVEARLH